MWLDVKRTDRVQQSVFGPFFHSLQRHNDDLKLGVSEIGTVGHVGSLFLPGV